MNTKTNSWDHFLQGNNKFNSIVLAGGVGLHAVDVFITISILPSIVRDVGGMQYYSLNTVLYIVASILGSALSITLLGKSPPSKAFNRAVTIFGAGTVICTFAPTMLVMLIGRTIQGFGGGLLFALTYSMIRYLYAPELWPRAMALISAMWGIATLIGPAVGGIFAEFHVWRFAFGSIGILSLIYGIFTNRVLNNFTKTVSSAENNKVPVLRLVLLVLCVLTVSLSSLNVDPFKNLMGLIVCAALFSVIIILEKRSTDSKILPSNSLSLKSPLLYIYMLMSFLVIGMQSEIFIPLFLQKIHHQTPFASGYIAALMAAGWSISSMFLSGVTSASGIKKIILISPVVAFIGSFLLSHYLPHEESSMISFGIGLFLVGAGIGMAYPYLVTRLFLETPANEQDLASASITTSQLFFTSLGAAVAGAVANFNGIAAAVTVKDFEAISKILLSGFLIFPAMAIILAIIVSKRIRQS